ncbi:MAG: hypothetical protein EBW06_08645, partial [Gammaproteobacteria bacterium]|nr:hypothetical protein [Gammaproteobacteria bacterium]
PKCDRVTDNWNDSRYLGFNDEPKEGEVDEFDLYAPVKPDDNDSPIIEELDKPEPLDGQDSDVGPPKPPKA